MTRIIEVTSCVESRSCPFLSIRNLLCTLNNRIITGIDSTTGFPDWCPLPVKEEEPEEFLPDLKY